MKILFFGDASHYHRTLAEALRRLGHEAVVASDGSRWMNTGRDIDLSRPLPGRLGGMALWAKLHTSLRPALSGYDVVQLSSSNIIHLRPERAIKVFRMLRRNNRSVHLTALGTDTPYLDFCLAPDGLRYNEWRVGAEPAPLALASPELLEEWRAPALRANDAEVYGAVSTIGTALFEYHAAVERAGYGAKAGYCGIPIDTSALTPAHEGEGAPEIVEFFVGMHRSRKVEKGTDRLLAAARAVEARFPKHCRVTVVENLPYDEYVATQRRAHVVLDQLYSYTPATNALLAMAQGIATVSGAEPEYYDFIGEHDNRPIINALPDDEALRATLADIVDNRGRLPELWRRSREFVIKHNDSATVARRFLELWNRNLTPPC